MFGETKEQPSSKMTVNAFRKHLSMPGMLRAMRGRFDAIDDPIRSRGISLSDCLMSGLAVFSMKMPSLLKFDVMVRSGEDPVQARNLRTLYGVERAPSDTWMRERLDEVDPRDLRVCFRDIHAALQRGRATEGWTVLGGHHLIAIDGTGHHSSKEVRCGNCCVKEHRDGTRTYYHQLLAAALVHPDRKEVFPYAPEPIRREDGTEKNDCERNAAKRLLNDLRREHPHLKAVITADGLSSNAPFIRMLREKDFRYILAAKPGDHRLLFSWFEASETRQVWETEDRTTGITRRFEWDSGVPLNDSSFELKVSMLRYEEKDRKGKVKRFSWVTDIPLSRETVTEVMRAARRRWAIENETFKTLKDGEGYNFEHNFGHGKNNLASIMGMLAMLSFLMDQVQTGCCGLFRKVLAHQKRRLYTWQRMRELFGSFIISDWKIFYLALSQETIAPELAETLPGGP